MVGGGMIGGDLVSGDLDGCMVGASLVGCLIGSNWVGLTGISDVADGTTSFRDKIKIVRIFRYEDSLLNGSSKV